MGKLSYISYDYTYGFLRVDNFSYLSGNLKLNFSVKFIILKRKNT